MDLKACRVLVTPTSFGRSDPRLWDELRAAVGEVVVSPHPRPLTSAEVRALLPGIHGYIAGLDVIDADALAAADSLRVIARYGIGTERVDLVTAQARGIAVCNTPGANAAAVAELTLGFMIALSRQMIVAHEGLKRGDWARVNGASLEGRTLGLVGFGAIARRTAVFARPFGVRVLACDPFVSADAIRAEDVTPASMDALLAESDFVSLHLPVTAETRGMVNRDFLARMKRGAWLINTARGDLIDEAALAAALENGHIAGAALDAFAQEPPPADSPLLAHPHVIVTPHIGGNSDSASNMMGRMALDECLAVLRGDAPRYRVV
jgi:D-3-phosphoglycerate dehydrogenase / 2-oxoglutarate reductase